jgi:hypothetical protein
LDSIPELLNSNLEPITESQDHPSSEFLTLIY